MAVLLRYRENELEIWHDDGERETRFKTELPAVQLLMSPDRCVAWINTEEQLRR